MAEREAHRSGRARRGFTLFEVLAAALILVLVGTLSIGSMNADLGRMSDARRRLEAGRLADRALADFEAMLFDGSAPEVQSETEEVDGFVVTRRVTPFGLFFAMTEDEVEEAPRLGDAVDDGAVKPFFPALASEFPGLPKHLRMIHVKVEWGNEMAPEKVERSTLAFDHQAALEALGNLAPRDTLAGDGTGQDAGDASSEEL